MFIGGIVVTIVGVLIAGFAWWAGETTGNAEWRALNCDENVYNRSPELERKCSAASGGMLIGIGSFLIAAVFLVVGVILTIVFGIKLAVDRVRKKEH
jgi:hypothetical protein